MHMKTPPPSKMNINGLYIGIQVVVVQNKCLRVSWCMCTCVLLVHENLLLSLPMHEHEYQASKLFSGGHILKTENAHTHCHMLLPPLEMGTHGIYPLGHPSAQPSLPSLVQSLRDELGTDALSCKISIRTYSHHKSK